MTHKIPETAAPIAGVDVELGGDIYVVPPLSLGALQQLRPRMKSLENAAYDEEHLYVIADAILAALRRNYPSMTREALLEMLDLNNVLKVFDVVMGASGMARAAADSGKARPVRTATVTSASSTLN